MKKYIISLCLLAIFVLSPIFSYAGLGTYLQINGNFNPAIKGISSSELTDIVTKNLLDAYGYSIDFAIGYNAHDVAIEASIGRLWANGKDYTYSANDMRLGLLYMPEKKVDGFLFNFNYYPYLGGFIGTSTIDKDNYRADSGRTILYGIKGGVKIAQIFSDSTFIDIGAIYNVRNFDIFQLPNRKETNLAYYIGIGLMF